jgi:hypothetical protein
MTRTIWRRAFAFTAAFLFALSWIFPLAAGLTKDKTSFPTWGPVDVTLAFVLAISAFGIQGLVREEVDKQAKETTYRFYRISTHTILAGGDFRGDRHAIIVSSIGFFNDLSILTSRSHITPTTIRPECQNVPDANGTYRSVSVNRT